MPVVEGSAWLTRAERRQLVSGLDLAGDMAFARYFAEGSDPLFVPIDDFDNDVIAAEWDNWGGGNIVESGGQLRLTTGTVAFAYYGIQRLPAETITGRFVGSRTVAGGNQALLGYGAYPVSLVFSASNEAYWVIVAGTAYAYTNIGGSFVERGQTPHVDGKIYVIGESAGDIVWKWSADGVTWSTAGTLADPFAGDRSVVPYIMVGTDQANGSTTTFVVDDFGWYAAPDVVAAVPGSILSTLGGITATVGGIRTAPGAVASDLGALSATAAGVRTVPGGIVSNLGGLSATSTAVRDVSGTVSTALGELQATATGSVTGSPTGTIASTLGALGATALGVRSVPAAAVGNLGALTATIVGGRTVPSAVSATLGPLSAIAAGTRTTTGQSAAMLGALSATAAATAVRLGLITTDLGALAASASGTSAPFVATTPRPDSGTTARAASGSTARASSGTTTRPLTTVTPRPLAGTTARP